MLQGDLIAKLIALGTAAADRVHHEQVPQGVAMPFMATTEIFANQPLTLDGRKLLASSQIRIAMFAAKGTDLESITQKVRTLNGFRGLLGTTKVHALRVETSPDEVAFADGDKVIKGKALDLFFKYEQES